MSLDGKTAVITGGGRGIGAAIARELAADRAALVVAARSPEQVEETAEAIRRAGGRAHATTCDVTDAEQVAALAAFAAEHLGHVDILVNNAGTAASAPLRSVTPEEWNRILGVNATGPYLCTRAFLEGMLERRWGRVVNVASIAGLTGAAYISAYTASKHAVIGFTRSVAAEVAAKGVTVNAVCPGYVNTPMTDASVAHIAAKTGMSREEAREELKRMSPQNRLFSPEEVAYAVRFLCDPRALGINGQAIVLDGGALLA